MKRNAPILIPLLALILAGVAPWGAALASSFPAASTGDIWFQVDHAGFRAEPGAAPEEGGQARPSGVAGSVIEEFYLRLPHDQLSFESPGDGEVGPWSGRVFVRLTFLDADESRVGEASRNFDITVVDEAAALSHDRVQLLVVREPLDPRTHAVRVDVEDMNARKRGLIYMITKQHRRGTTQGDLLPPPFSAGGFGLSDLQFAWTIDRRATDPHFDKRGLEVVPNPSRAYGLYQDTLSAYCEVYDPVGSGPLVTRAQIRDDQGRAVGEMADTLLAPQAEGLWVATPRLPVGKFPPGTYDLAFHVQSLDGSRTAELSRPFNVIWSDLSWGRSEQDVLDEARSLLTETEYERFKELQLGDRETYLANFWAAHDPSPTTARNELREVFLQRVEYANRNFREFEKGMRSDRGRVYVRFGPPDEITREVLPTPGTTLSEILDPSDPGMASLIDSRSSHSGSTDQTQGDFHNVDTRPYEIWKYTRMGDPLFPERERITPNDGLTFIFVDDAGVGRYTLRYSNSFKRF